MPSQEALDIVNDLRRQLARLARSIVQAYGGDNRLSAYEHIRLGNQGVSLAASLGGVLEEATPELRQDILAVLEHGELRMPA